MLPSIHSLATQCRPKTQYSHSVQRTVYTVIIHFRTYCHRNTYSIEQTFCVYGISNKHIPSLIFDCLRCQSQKSLNVLFISIYSSQKREAKSETTKKKLTINKLLTYLFVVVSCYFWHLVDFIVANIIVWGVLCEYFFFDPLAHHVQPISIQIHSHTQQRKHAFCLIEMTTIRGFCFSRFSTLDNFYLLNDNLCVLCDHSQDVENFGNSRRATDQLTLSIELFVQNTNVRPRKSVSTTFLCSFPFP